MSYFVTDKSGKIIAASDMAFPAEVVEFYESQDCTITSGAYECGYDGQLYRAGEAPVKSAALVEAEAFANLRIERNNRLEDYDKAVAQIQRDMRLADASETPALEALLAKWDAYAQALCDLPAQKGAPWDGGGEQTPWPAQPE